MNAPEGRVESTTKPAVPVGTPSAGFKPLRTTRGTVITPPPQGSLALIPVENGFDGRQSRSEERWPGDKQSRSISASAPVPSGKAIRGRETPCVPPSDQRNEDTLGSIQGALVPFKPSSSQGAFKRPYETWTIEKYTKSSGYNRELFWQRASISKKMAMADFLNAMPERDVFVQEARLEFGAEKFGLRPGAGAGSSSGGASGIVAGGALGQSSH